MGAIFAVGDSAALADALIYLLRKRKKFAEKPVEAIRWEYSPENAAKRYERLFDSLGAG